MLNQQNVSALVILTAGLSSLGWAQSNSNSGVADMGRVEITDKRDNDTELRRESTVSKIVVGRQEIEKMGYDNIGDVLKNQPGISIGGPAGRGSGVRMHGLSVGYTQILLDGQRVPPGFSIESLTPEMVERIEIYRAPTAETGTRAVAGTINIITREGKRGEPMDLKVAGSWQGAQWSPSMSLSEFKDHGTFTANYTLNVFRNQVPNASDSLLQRQFTSTATAMTREALSQSLSRREGFNSTARIQVKGDPGETLTWMPFLMYANVYSPGNIGVTQSGSGASVTGSDDVSTMSQSHYGVARLNGQWKKRIDQDSNLELKLNGGGWQSVSNSAQQDLTGSILPNLSLNNTIQDRSINTSIKYTDIRGGGHQWVSGSEWEQVHRTETALATPAFSGGNTQMGATSLRYALYTQDEWQINPNWGTYSGLRYEHLLTDGNNGLTQAQNNSSVLSPLFHAMWRPEAQSKDQVRLSLTRSYKAPNMNTLMAPYIRSSSDSLTGANGPTTADSVGNPNLKPELATGLDLAFERYLPQGGVISTSLFYRHIDNLTRTVVSQGSDGRWVAMPQNIGSAKTQGVELEAKFKLNQWIEQAPEMDIRSNVSFYNSQVDGIVGPYNRLDQQPHMSGNFGADYRLRSMPLTVGGNLNITPAYDTQVSNEQLVSVSQKRVIDLYGLWRVDPSTAWRLTLSNLDPLSYSTTTLYNAVGVIDDSTSTNRSYVNVQLRWEKKL